MRIPVVALIAITAAAVHAQQPGRGEAPLPDSRNFAQRRQAWTEADQKLPQAMPDKTILELVDMLDDHKFANREAATTALMLRQDFDDVHMVAALRGAKTPEMRHRVTQIAMHRYFQRLNPATPGGAGDTGSLGVDIEPRNVIRPDQQPGLKHPAMLIGKTKPGFPAFAMLRPGDLVLSINGKTFPDDLDQTDFIGMIQQHQPGDVMNLEVLRNGNKLAIPVRLDSRQRLERVHTMILDVLDPSMYAPWQVYFANMLDMDDPDPVIRIEFPEPSQPAKQEPASGGGAEAGAATK